MGRMRTLATFGRVVKKRCPTAQLYDPYRFMKDESHSPDEPVQALPPAPPAPVEPDSPALATDLEDSFFETRRLRHDGWNGPAMATFCRTLAETGIVTEACRACGKAAKSAYALRQREPLFARAWESALSLARERLADDLLARSLKGSAEQIIRDGCIWGERHSYDNKLAFAILRRLDRRAELGATFRTPPADRIPDPVPAVSGDWQMLLDALSEGRKEDAALLLTPIPPEIDESNEGNNPRPRGWRVTTWTNLMSPNASGRNIFPAPGAPVSRHHPTSTARRKARGRSRAIRAR